MSFVRHAENIVLTSLSIFAVLSLAGCHSSQSASDKTNTRTNDTSAYVNKHMNTRKFKMYTTATTYNKPVNTVEFHLNRKTLRELQGRRPNKYQGMDTSSRDSRSFHRLIKKNMLQLRKQAHNKSVRAKLMSH